MAKVSRLDGLLQVTDHSLDTKVPGGRKMPSDLTGVWKDTISGSIMSAGFVGEELLVPYSYSRDTRLTGVFFGFSALNENL